MKTVQTELQIFKNSFVQERAKLLHPLLIDVMADTFEWAHDRNLEYIVTETVTTNEEDKALGRVSSSHRERRAFDLRSAGWPQHFIIEFISHFNFKYYDIAAITATTKKPALVVHHDAGTGMHFHIQIHAKYAFKFDS